MGILDFLNNLFNDDKQKIKPNNRPAVDIKIATSKYGLLFKKLYEESIEEFGNNWFQSKFTALPSYQTVKDLPQQEKIAFTKHLILEKCEIINAKQKDNITVFGENSYRIETLMTSLISLILRSIKFDNEDDLYEIGNSFIAHKSEYLYHWPFTPLISQFEKYKSNYKLTPKLSSILKKIKKKIITSRYLDADLRKLLRRIDDILILEEEGSSRLIFTNDRVGIAIKKHALNNETLLNLIKLFEQEANKSKPTKKWLKEMEGYKDSQVIDALLDWFDTTIEIIQEIHKSKTFDERALHEVSIDRLKGAVWFSGVVNNNILTNKVEALGLWCFKKLPGHGAVSVKLGNATIYAFSILPFKDGIERLTKFRMKIKYSSVLSIIEKSIKLVAEKEGKSMDQLEEMSVSDYSLESNWTVKQQLGDVESLIQLESFNKVQLLWVNSKGKEQKTIPTHIKEDFKVDIKFLKSKVKDIQTSLSAHKSRIESYFLKKRRWQFEEWKEFYFEHPFISYLSHSIIWTFERDGKKVGDFIYHNKAFISPINSTTIDELKGCTITLWHPIYGETKEVQKWRELLFEKEIKQPFKQAFREVYFVTEAELNTDTYSNRYAAHVLQQHQFTALCKQRHWAYTVMGNWDSHNIPSLKVANYDIRVEFWVEGDWEGSSANENGIFNYIYTDQVRIYDRDELMRMGAIPPIIFSEVMRDVDLFVGVTSIGNNPEWSDQGNDRLNNYWHNYSFQDLAGSAIERKKTLEYLIPKLKIGALCTFEEKYMVVEGKLRTYKIHIGSGNILMKPNDQYLCIVPDRSTKAEKVFLPFEGDNTLSVIISKAFLLAEDDKINDKTITSQINR